MASGNAQLRKVLVTIHLYIGLVCGLVLSIAGLTGSLIVFWQPIDTALNSELLTPDPVCTEPAFRPIDELVAAVQAKIPPSGRLTSLDFPDHERSLLWVWYQTPAPQAEWGDIYTVFVKPCSGEVTGPRLWNSQQRPWGGPLMSALIQLHTSLWLNQWSILFGNHVLSFGSVLVMGSILVGYYLWWPSRGNWRSAFTIKRSARGTRLHYDLHKVVGACAGCLLLVSLLTGVYLYSPWTDLIDRSVNLFSPVTALAAQAPVSTPIEGQEPITVGRILEISKTTLSSGRPISLEFPVDEQGTYLVTVDTGVVWKSQVSVDQYSGAVVRVQGPQAASAGDHMLAWLFPLHTGQAFGLPGRTVLVVLGAIPTCLYMTGFFLWWRKRRMNLVEDRL
jgi:uncharacterized iron-regulated membrane protein